MILTIKGFRTIQEYECEFQHESITLISGPSGAGKTTLMNAIFWCLYGTLKNVRKFGTKTGPCSVKIDLGSVKITRSKSPEALLIEELGANDEITCSYKDDAAQERIINLYGSSMIWLSSCYLSQGTRNKFLESPPSERLALLSELCFSNQSPEEYLEKIEEKLKSTNKNFERENDFYKRDLDLFQKKRKEYPKYKDDLLTLEQKQSFQEKIHSQDLQMLQDQLSTAEKIESSYLSLLDTRNHLSTKFPNYKEYLLSQDEKNNLTQIISTTIPSCSPQRQLFHLENEIQDLERKRVLLISYLDQYEQKKLEHHFVEHQNHLLSKESFLEIHLLSQRLPIEIGEMEKKARELSHYTTNYSTWSKELEDLEIEKSEFRSDIDMQTRLVDLSKKIQMINDSNENKRKREELLCQLKEYEDVLSIDVDPRKIESQEMIASIMNEEKVGERVDLLKKMGIQDQKDCVQKAIDIRKRVIEVQSLWSFVDKLQSLETLILDLDEKISKLKCQKGKNQWISEKNLPEKILELNSLKETLICPKCTTSLRFESNHLVECSSPVSKERVDLLSKWIEDSKKRLEWLQEKQILEEDMNRMMIEFEKNCENIHITQEGLYDFPRLDEIEKQKLFQEMMNLERVLPSFHLSVHLPSETLRQMNRKWEASMIEKKIDLLKESDGWDG
jgi:DNA repair exonuclease SbcCD ATPase subunit